MPTYLDAHVRDSASALSVHASITLRHHGSTVRVASSSRRAALCDQAEAQAEDGPCVVAMSGLRAVVIPDLAAEQRWPAWSRVTKDAGFAAVVAVPAVVDPASAVALNLYLDPGRGWSERDGAVALAHVEAIAADVRDRIEAALSPAAGSAAGPGGDAVGDAERVEQAVGVLMQANGCDARTARALLELVAARDGTDVSEVASVLLAAIHGHG